MESAIETFEHAGFRVSIYQDEHEEGPGQWGNGKAEGIFLRAYHRQFHVDGVERGITSRRGRAMSQDEAIEFFNAHKNARGPWRVYPLYAYIHSGVCLSLGSDPSGGFDPGGWDTSHLGFIAVRKRDFPGKERARKAAESLVETWNQYLSGDVYGYVVEARVPDADGDEGDATYEEVDSCWGCYGIEDARQQAREAAEHNQRQVPLPFPISLDAEGR